MANTISVSTVVISGTAQTIDADAYIRLVPTNDGDSVSNITPIGQDFEMIAEIANADPTLSKTVYLEGGTPGPYATTIFVKPPATRYEIPPACTVRLAYQADTGWSLLVPGTLV